MKNLKKLMCLFCGILLLAACGKKDNPGPAQQDIDPTQYYIAGKVAATEFGKSVAEPYALLIKPNAQALLLTIGGASNGTYTYKNGHLVFTILGGGFIIDFTISNNAITGFNNSGSINATLTSNSLEKIPAANAFTGLFKGSLGTTGNVQPIAPYLLFSGSKYGFGTNTSPVTNFDYTLQNNGIATSNTGANGTLSFFVMAGGKLEVARRNLATVNGAGSFDYGTYTQQ